MAPSLIRPRIESGAGSPGTFSREEKGKRARVDLYPTESIAGPKRAAVILHAMIQRARYPALIAALLACAPAMAVHVQGADISGIADPDALHNATQSLSLLRAGTSKGADISDERLAFLLRQEVAAAA